MLYDMLNSIVTVRNNCSLGKIIDLKSHRLSEFTPTRLGQSLELTLNLFHVLSPVKLNCQRVGTPDKILQMLTSFSMAEQETSQHLRYEARELYY